MSKQDFIFTIDGHHFQVSSSISNEEAKKIVGMIDKEENETEVKDA